jgi:hypothetical protein
MWLYSGVESSKEGSTPVLLTANIFLSLSYDRSTASYDRSTVSYDRSTASSKTSFHTPRSILSAFIFQHPLISLRSSVAAHVFFPVFPSLIPYTFSSILQVLTSTSLSSRHFFPTSFPSSCRCLSLLPCLPVTSHLPLSHHPVGAYLFFLVLPSFLPYTFASISCFIRQFLRRM